MGEHTIKLPDVGEGVAEAELVEWHVKVGDLVREDDVVAAVMTDKATVEIPAPVDGEIVWLGAEVGEIVSVGSPIVRIKTGDDAGEAPAMDDGERTAPVADGMSGEGQDLPPPPAEEAPEPQPQPEAQVEPGTEAKPAASKPALQNRAAGRRGGSRMRTSTSSCRAGHRRRRRPALPGAPTSKRSSSSG